MATYSNEEYADILVTCGRVDCVAGVALRLYGQLYPRRRLPNNHIFINTCRLSETGSVHHRKFRIGGQRHNMEIDERILAALEEDNQH
ncbi:hypothetical protein EVAR_99435_1 [Eumeta japonica]|uniref:Uncharacterized protein n=1 Tax=Eumeta variegata TaxID=151549 RepID=A0A4C1Z9P5_EUMVA|nr:hypothetical protein EVAR_99435_1 [Eumeta japonica]